MGSQVMLAIEGARPLPIGTALRGDPGTAFARIVRSRSKLLDRHAVTTSSLLAEREHLAKQALDRHGALGAQTFHCYQHVRQR